MTKTESKPALSPDDLLKAVVAGKTEPHVAPATVAATSRNALGRSMLAWLPRDARTRGFAGAALAVGAVLGAGIMALPGSARTSNDAVVALGTTLDASRIETARLSGEVAQLHQTLADLRAASEAARKEAGTRGAALGERLGQIDRTLAGKIAALGDRFEQVEREQTGRIANLATLIDRRPATAPVAKAEPVQTGSIGEAKNAEARSNEVKGNEVKATEKAADARATDTRVADARSADPRTLDTRAKPAAPEKPAIIDGWAVRDVYNGMAVLEDRRRRLVEVGPGDTLPGIGRVEAIERHGREWVVTTRQGLVTPQPW